jgi:hypothetical protein
MKTLKFNSKSWHYLLATKIGDFDEDGGDFCSYVRNVIFGVLLSLFLIAAASFVLYTLGREIYAAYTCWFTPVCTFDKFEQIAVLVACIAAAILGLIFLMVWNAERRARIREEIYMGMRVAPEPGFVKMAYKSIKEKTCFKVEFK